MIAPKHTRITAVPGWIRFNRWQRLEPWLYLFYVGVLTLLVAHAFFQSRATQLSWSEAAKTALEPAERVRQLPAVWWSAPLDDTFIHFDFARSFANLRPFEWTHEGGYSSGATSWLYPMLLAVGVRMGFDGQHLGTFADVIACTSMFGFFWAARSLFTGLPQWTSYIMPVLVLTSGVLGWSIWSGMELGLFFGIWAVLAHFFVAHRVAVEANAQSRARLGMAISGLLLVMTRPEALLCCGLFALFAGARDFERHLQLLPTIAKILGPSVAFTLLRGLVNLVLTGSIADAGALVKLYSLRPFLEPREMALKWLDNIGFQFSRITVYHTSDDALWGWEIWVLVVLALLPKRTRLTVVLLVLQAIGWILLVSLNEYVRYQNDRYTMPAVLWLLLASALGLGGLIEQALRRIAQNDWVRPLASCALATLITGSFVFHQFPRQQQQLWLFGRACRNIAEQQIRVGQLLGAGQFGAVQRILVGDAGAIPYFSELRGVDIIGLGGTLRLPFAKAVNLGVGATVELIERLSADERPDYMALYPSWWDLLPVWFGRRLDEVHIHGNVICGGVSKVVYEAEWRGLEKDALPLALAPGARIIDELDFADVVSESEHGYQISSRHSGYVVMKVLPHPKNARQDLFDAGRLVFSDAKARFFLHGLRRGEPATLIFRAAPNHRMAFLVKVDGRDAGRIEIDGGSIWQEAALELDPKHLREQVSVELTAETSEHILYHLWAVTR